MKYKHGFIGNSSSASYYIRRGLGSSTKTAELVYDSGQGTEEAKLSSSGHATNSYYCWHHSRTSKMQAKLVIPLICGGLREVVVGETTAMNGIKQISFVAYAVVSRSHRARWLSHNTLRTDSIFSENTDYTTYATYTLDTTITGRTLSADDSWVLDLKDAAFTVDDPIGDAGDWLSGGVVWDGSTLTISVDYQVGASSYTFSSGVGLKEFKVTQGESVPT